MSEQYRILTTHREPTRPTDRVGLRVRVQLSGHPTRRWSRGVRARLASELSDHRVAHVPLNELVQGDEIVLNGITPRETPALADALHRAIHATNHAPAADLPIGQRGAPQADTTTRTLPPATPAASDPPVEVPSQWFG